MCITQVETNNALELLETTPARIALLSQNIANSNLYFRPNPNTWSANDVLAHLRACADVWGKSILEIIAKDKPKLRYISPRSWIRKTNYLEQEFQESLKVFTSQRSELLRVLKGLKIEDWSRSATFTGTTKGREQTVFSYAHRMAEHEHKHCVQIETVLKLAAVR